MSFIPSFIVDKRKFYSQNSTHLFFVFPSKGKRVRVITNYVQLLLIGLCLGVTLGIAFVPLFEIQCYNKDTNNSPTAKLISEGSNEEPVKSANEFVPVDSGPVAGNENKAISPVIIENSKGDSVEKSQIKSKEINTQKKGIRRPRFFSSELGLKQKLIAGIILTDYTRIENLIAINKTLSPFVNQLVFFVVGQSAANKVKSLGLSEVVTLSDKALSSPSVNNTGSDKSKENGIGSVSNLNNLNDTLRLDKSKYNRAGLRGMKYFGDKFADSYDYFFMSLDVFYINGKKLLNSVKKISISQEVLWGAENEANGSGGSGGMCKLETGFVLSSSLIRKLSTRVERCLVSSSLKMGGNLTKCFYYSLGSVECCNSIQNQRYIATSAESTNQTLNAIAIGPVSSHHDIYKLHVLVSEKRTLEIGEDIENLSRIMDEMVPHLPKGLDIISWPPGLPKAHEPSTRFDVLNWKYFTLEEVYPKNEHETLFTPSGIEKLDISSVVNTSMYYLRGILHGNSIDSFPTKFDHGYRRFDETRGMEYILNFVDTQGQTHTIECLRPLTKIEIVPMPFVTENRRLTIVLPIRLNQFNETEGFLTNFVDLSVDRKSNTVLIIAFILEEPIVETHKAEQFHRLRKLIIEHNYNLNKKDNVPGPSTAGAGSDSLKIGFVVVYMKQFKTSNYALAALDMLAGRALSANTLVLALDGFVTLKDEFLNRVRMSTILNSQVFSPIPFFEYNPLVSGIRYVSKELEIHKATGYFNKEAFNFVSFFIGDYSKARKHCTLSSLNEATTTRPGVSIIPYLFLQGSQLHILRAPEPSLKIRFSSTIYENCSKTRDCFKYQWGTKAELAKLIFQAS